MSLVNKNILVIDDDDDVLILVKKIIEGTGAKCFIAKTVREGFTLALSFSPHLIIVDLSIPKIDGFTFLEKKRSIFQIKNIPSLVLSATSDKKELNRAMALGAADYLNKPINATRLIQKLRKCLRFTETVKTVTFSENPKATVRFNAELVEVSDEHISFSSSAKLKHGKIITLDSSLLEECSFRKPSLKIDGRSVLATEHGQYITKAKFVGLSDDIRATLKDKIRHWK